MALQAQLETKHVKSNRVPQDEIAIGGYLARVAQVIDLGVQRRKKWDDTSKSFVVDTDKAPAPAVMLTYELTTEFMKDEQGNEVEDKPRWMSEDFHVFALDNDLATSTKRYKGIDPANKFKGDFAALAAAPCTVVIAHKKNGKAKVGSIAPAMKGIPVPELKNPVKVFDVDAPDMEVFNSLPEWLRGRICENIHYAGSALQRAVEGVEVKQGDDKGVEEKASQEAVEEPNIVPEADDSNPW